VRERFDGLVTAAAAGSDLLLAEVALDRSIPVHLVLPFDPGRFREESVADRGGRWVRSYDRTLDAVGKESAGSLLVLDFDPDDVGFRATNGALLERACLLSPGRVLAVAVRPRERRGPPSVTDDFVERAEQAGLFVVEIDPLTC
jgi:hypothetical protein